MNVVIHNELVNGVDIDANTRCAHYHSDLDIIAVKFKCCGVWFPCFECHSEIADHEAKVWQREERDITAVLCGKCGHTLTINEYLGCDSTCPGCEGRFNPGCANHHHLYFA